MDMMQNFLKEYLVKKKTNEISEEIFVRMIKMIVVVGICWCKFLNENLKNAWIFLENDLKD